MLDFKEYLTLEAYSIPISKASDVDNFDTKYPKKELKKLLKHVKSLKLDDIPIVGSDGATKSEIGKIKIRGADPKSKDEISQWVQDNTTGLKGSFLYGRGTPKAAGQAPKPSGSKWESLITHKYNKLVGDEKHDPKAFEDSQEFYPTYEKAAEAVANSFKNDLGATSKMTQYGGTGGMKNLSDSWKDWGGKNGTPKTDMYTNNFNISLKKEGGSQLATGGSGETVANFHAALEYIGSSKKEDAVIGDIMTKIQDKFLTLHTRFNKTDLETIAKGQSNIKLSADDKEVMKKYNETEKFHKDLNKELDDVLDFGKRPEFRKWYIFEAMSGLKKFKNIQSVASVCVTFDPKKGTLSKINVTPDGKSSGLKGNIPKVSLEVETLAQKVKIFSAWKSTGVSPRSVLRLTSSYNPLSNTTTKVPLVEHNLIGIVRDVLKRDYYANKVIQNLHEEMERLDEFAIIKKVVDKIKGLAGSAKAWVQSLSRKIMDKVKKTLQAIKKLGVKMFDALLKFLGLELKSVKETIPTDIHGFVYGMAD